MSELMHKTPITRAELTSKVLAEVSEHEECRGVIEVAITPVEMEGHGSTWHANIVDSGTSNIGVSMTVVRKVTEKLEPLFEVVD